MKFNSYAIILVSCLITSLMAMETGETGYLFPVKEVVVVTKDKNKVRVSEALAKHFGVLKKKIDQKEIGTPVEASEVKAKDLNILISFMESPFEEKTISLDDLLGVLATAKSLKLELEPVKKAIFKAYADTLTWDERSLGEALNKPNTVISKEYKQRIAEAFVSNPRNQAALVKGKERNQWNELDLDTIFKYQNLNMEARTQLIKALIEAREGLLEAIVGYENVHDYRCKQDPERAEQCPFELFAKEPTEKDTQLVNEIKDKLKNYFVMIERELREKYPEATE